MQSLVSENPALKEHSQLRDVDFVSVYFKQETFQVALENLAEFMKDMAEEAKWFASHTGETLVKVRHLDSSPTFADTRMKNQDLQLSQHVVGATTGPAGAVWPDRLVTQALDDLRQEHGVSFFLQTNAPVRAVQLLPEESELSHPWQGPPQLPVDISQKLLAVVWRNATTTAPDRFVEHVSQDSSPLGFALLCWLFHSRSFLLFLLMCDTMIFCFFSLCPLHIDSRSAPMQTSW
ncbi:hypothetical protein EDB80DRAFT_825268 [Ilyonectria destructans]|nr:hypothetical protein EDB80DRAFT_825268 [Ilyonectria destructans]